MLFVSMNGPRQEAVELLYVCGAILWGQGKCKLKTCPMVAGSLEGFYVFKDTAGNRREAKLGHLSYLVSHSRNSKSLPCQYACL